jgi:Mycothiol maleylpyruvate isomerase N-terminal domain
MSTCVDLLPSTASECVAALTPYVDRDWLEVTAADLDWSCSETARHICDDLYFYAMQVIYAQPRGYVCTELKLDDTATPARLLEAFTAHAELLRRTVRAADPDDRAHHNYGNSDPEGFAAMGMVETLIHTLDVVRGLNPDDDWQPSPHLASAVLSRLFPDAPAGEPAEVLLYCCGRGALGELPRQHEWSWDGTVRT